METREVLRVLLELTLSALIGVLQPKHKEQKEHKHPKILRFRLCPVVFDSLSCGESRISD